MTSSGTPMPRQDAAALLGVPVTATPAEVQRAYLRAARTSHPDLLPQADEAGRRAAGAAFDRLTRARDVLLDPASHSVSPDPAGGDVPGYQRVEGRGLGGSLVVLVLLGFLLMALVNLQQGLGSGIATPPDPPAASTSP